MVTVHWSCRAGACRSRLNSLSNEGPMTSDEKNIDAPAEAPPYETPAIEEVVTPENIEREVAYAGLQVISRPEN